MRINWPCVSRQRYNALNWQYNQARLELDVARSSVQHLTDRRLEHVTSMAKAAVTIDRLTKTLAEMTAAIEAKC